jgi:hypothetical protein
MPIALQNALSGARLFRAIPVKRLDQIDKMVEFIARPLPWNLRSITRLERENKFKALCRPIPQGEKKYGKQL